MIHGQLYDITWRTAVNADWTRSETLLFTGTHGPYAIFEDRHSIEKPFHIRPEWITELAVAVL